MKDPNTELTESGVKETLNAIFNFAEGGFFFINHSEELELDDDEIKMIEDIYHWSQVQMSKFSISYEEETSD